MDALLCCKNGTDNVFAMLQEAYRSVLHCKKLHFLYSDSTKSQVK